MKQSVVLIGKRVRAHFDEQYELHKAAAKEYFQGLVNEAMKYNISEVPDLVLSMEYRNGEVYLSGDKPHVDLKA